MNNNHEPPMTSGPAEAAPPVPPAPDSSMPAVSTVPAQQPAAPPHPPQPPVPYYPPQPYPVPHRPTSGLAVVSLISGILSYVFLPLIGALVAILTGHLARAEVRRNAHMEGAGLALGGLILGYLNLFLMVAITLFSLFVFGSLGFFIRQIIATVINDMK